MDTTQPNALRLANMLRGIDSRSRFGNLKLSEASTELERLHADNADLRAQLVQEAARTASEKLRADQMTEQHRMQAAMNTEARAELASIGAGGVSALMGAANAGSEPVAKPIDRTALIDLIAETLSGTFHCTRTWAAWHVGTMSQDDFGDVGESDTPHELADAVISLIGAAHPSPPEGMAGWQDIATAPKNGREVLGYTAEVGALVLYWDTMGSETDRWSDGMSTHSWAPTHWMPLPAPPLASEAKGASHA